MLTIKQVKACLMHCISADVPAFLWGAPGVGKSDAVRGVAAELKIPLIDVRAVLLDPVDLRGLPVVKDGAAAWCVPDFLPREKRDGKKGILFLDELNAAPASTQAALFQLVLDRKLGEYALPAGWRIIAAGNRQTDKAAANKMPSALANRFLHLDVQVDVDAWCEWAEQNGISPMLQAFLRFRPSLLHSMENSDYRTFASPRSWARVAAFLDQPTEERKALISGLVGPGPAGELLAFFDTWSEMPSPEEIINDPEGARVPPPDKTSIQHAVAIGLSRKINKTNFEAVLRYLQRLAKPHEVLAVLEATARDATLTKTAAFKRWNAENEGVKA